ncbi:sensor histidine kinase [Bradyrhizobium sp.]|uniref:sensor histidine kinase n=1 Tax=Bradyrhizobium sp. TaxID=376 RepID=UPI003C333F88
MRNCDTNRQELEPVQSGEPDLIVSRRGLIAERLLLREFLHRTNNELACAIGLVSLAARRCENDEAGTSLKKVVDRLESYAGIQNSLQPPDYSTAIDISTYIYRLCRAVSRSKLEQQQIELSLSLHTLIMRSEQCWLLGMILFELLTNAARHAFDGKPGKIHIDIYPTDSSVVCSVRDNGKAALNPTMGRGLSIVQELAASLRGTIDSQSGPSGTTTIVRFPH